jgi:hypothetical protein
MGIRRNGYSTQSLFFFEESIPEKVESEELTTFGGLRKGQKGFLADQADQRRCRQAPVEPIAQSHDV